MLPFTKRPGRDDTSDVVPKDELPKSPASVPPPSMVKRSVPPPPPPAMSSTHSSIKHNLRPPQDSVGEDEMTGILQSRSFTGPILPIPAAGRLPDVASPVSQRPNIRPAAGGPANLRSPPPGSTASSLDRGRLANQADEEAEDEDDGRTVVRGAPKIVKRTAKKNNIAAAPASISPAAVIKATLENARQNNARARERDRDLTGPNNVDVLMAGPPRDLLEDSDDLREPAQQRNPNAVSAFARTAQQQQPPAHFQQPPTQQFGGEFGGGFSVEGPPSHRPPPISVEGPPSYPPSSSAFNINNGPPSSHPGMLGMHSSVGVRVEQPASSYAAAYAPVAPQSVPGVAPSMPAHFMTPQAPGYAADPPGTAVTSGHRVAGRPAISWAAALLACGLFVGVAAVGVMQSSDSIADTTASFVDPSRAPVKAQGAAPQVAPPQTIPVDSNGTPKPQAPPTGVVVGASPTPPTPAPAETATAPVVAAPPGGVVMTGFAPVPVTTTNIAPTPPAKAEKPEKPTAAAPKWKPAPAAPRPAVAKADKGEDDPPPKPKAEKPEKPEKTAKGDKKGSASEDAETKKALDALQKAQLESASSFGGKE